MKAIRLILIGLTMTLSSLAQPAQRGGGPEMNKERLESIKIGMITNRLDLSPEEAKVFWPVYNKYSDELEDLRKNRRDNLLNTRENFDKMSDAEIEKAVDNEIAFRSAEVDIMKKYHPQFKKILPIQKVAKLYKTEEDFKRRLVEMIRDRKGDKRGPNQREGSPDRQN
jgi:hypothetical protein